MATILLVFIIGIAFFSSDSQVSYTDAVFGYDSQIPNLFITSENGFPVHDSSLIFAQDNTLIAVSSPGYVSFQVLGAQRGINESDKRTEIISYKVEQGDTFASIAGKMDISINTILWANNLTSSSKLKEGQELVILPTTGLIHYARKGDTLSGLAQTYKAKVDDIVSFNELEGESDIFIGDMIIVPDGTMPPPQSRPTYAQTPISSSYFIAPTNGVITQGLHWNNAIDFGNACGAPVFASAGGTIQRVSYGWNGGLGNYITILHPNGAVTLYAHLSTIQTRTGAYVSQGTIVGRVGNTGRTIGPTGCHVHFEVRGATNPFTRYKIGSRP